MELQQTRHTAAGSGEVRVAAAAGLGRARPRARGLAAPLHAAEPRPGLVPAQALHQRDPDPGGLRRQPRSVAHRLTFIYHVCLKI